ncbi:MAG: PorV/PorQ family protein [Fibrobacterota bacterium]
MKRLFSLLLLPVLAAHAGLIHEPGETVLPLMKMPLSVRTQAMGGAGAAAVNDGAYASVNPAGILALSSDAVFLEHANYLQGGRIEYLNATLRYGPVPAGVTLQYTDYGSAPLTTDGSDFNTDNTFHTYDAVATLSSGFTFRQVRFGAGLKAFRHSLFTESMSGAALDIGALWDTPLAGVTAGAALLNLGLAEKVGDTRYPLTTLLRAGAAYSRLVSDRLAVNAALDVNAANDGTLAFPLGAEVRWNGLCMRGGYHFLHDTQSFSAGAGFSFSRWTLDYGYLHFREGLVTEGRPHSFALHMAL